jgi:hypothetical protein
VAELLRDAELRRRPSLQSEVPVAQREASPAKTCLPSTWLSRPVRIERVDAYGSGVESSGTFLEERPDGVIVALAGERTWISFEGLRAVTLVND